MPAARRGWQPLGRVMLETRFPLGLFRAWSYVEPDCRCLVYPRPEPGALPPPAPSRRPAARARTRRAATIFPACAPTSRRIRRATWPGNPPRAANNMLTKQFAGEAVAELWLTLRDLPTSLGLEARLSRLAGWVLAAERSGAHYGLRLPGTEIAPARGDAHRGACLEALALYQAGGMSARERHGAAGRRGQPAARARPARARRARFRAAGRGPGHRAGAARAARALCG